MALRLITAPAAEPITLDEAKQQVRQELDADDAWLAAAIAAARDRAEAMTGRVLMKQTWELDLEGFPGGSFIRIPKPPLQEIESLKYYDAAGAEETLDPAIYFVDSGAEPGRVWLRSSQSWPSIELQVARGVVIRFVAGYSTNPDIEVQRGAIPPGMKQLIRFLVGHYYEHREAVALGVDATEVPEAVQALAWQNRVLELG